MIDKKYFEPNPALYFRDMLIPLATFFVAFAWAVNATWPWVVLPYLIAVVSVHRAGIFGHEIVHRPGHPRMKAFNAFWNWTAGALIMLPAVRFMKPHLTHHANGTFRTKDDPQYLLVRSDGKLMFFVLVLIPFIMPLFNLFLVLTASLGGIGLEEAIERHTRRRGFSLTTPMSSRQKVEVARLSRHYLILFVVYVALLPQTLPLFYAVLVGGWFLTVARIPLEHELERYAEKSVARDQMRDSFTVETPLAVLLQPVGFRYHTAHHMYPGVPYHNLPAVHAELKRGSEDYRASIISLWAAIRGPKRPAAAPQATTD